MYAAVDSQHQTAAGSLAQFAKFFERSWIEFLAAETRHDAHHQHGVARIQIGLDGRQRRRRIDRQAGPRSQTVDFVQQRPRIVDGFDVKRQMVGPGTVIGRQIIGRVRDHQMGFDRQGRIAANGIDDRQAIGQIRHEMAVHHVQMEHLGSGRLDPLNLVGQVPKVAHQQCRHHNRQRRSQLREPRTRCRATINLFGHDWGHKKCATSFRTADAFSVVGR